MPGINHVFVDYENIRRVDPAIFEMEGTAFTLLLGPQNRTLDAAVVEQLMARAAVVELVRIEEPGRNAVDFALAYYLGRKVVTDPAAFFHIISNDKGYDHLIEHLQSRKVRVRRHEDFESLTFSTKPPAPASLATPASLAKVERRSPVESKAPVVIGLVTRVIAHLQRNTNSRPKRKKTLMGQLGSQFLKGAPLEEVEQLIATLVKGGHLRIDEKGAITYLLAG